MALLKAADYVQGNKKIKEKGNKHILSSENRWVPLLLDIPQPAFYLCETPNLLSIIWETMTHQPGIGRLGFNSSLAIMSVNVCVYVCVL